MKANTSSINRSTKNIIICTRDLEYGVGSQVKYDLNLFDKDSSVECVTVIGPKVLEGFSNKIKFIVLPNKGTFFLTKEPYFAFKCNRIILKLIKNNKIDTIYLHFPIYAHPYGAKIIRKVHLLHQSIIRHYPKTFLFFIGAFFHYLYSYFDLRSIKYASHVHFVSRSIMQDAEQFFPEYKHKFEYQPNRIDKNIFFRVPEKNRHEFKKTLGIVDHKINILFVGRLEPLKGIKLILKVLTDINHKDIRLIVVGDGPLKNNVAAYPFAQHVGKVEHTEMNKYYNISDIFVMPSYYETFGLTVFEALVCGCKILSRNVGDAKFAVDRDSLFTDDKEFKQKLNRVIVNLRKSS